MPIYYETFASTLLSVRLALPLTAFEQLIYTYEMLCALFCVHFVKSEERLTIEEDETESKHD